MARVFRNFLGGETDVALGSGDTTLSSPALAALDTIASPDVLAIVLDPDGIGGAPEIVEVTAHATGSTTATITRAAESTTARAHPAGTEWVGAVTSADLARFAGAAPHKKANQDKAGPSSTTSTAFVDLPGLSPLVVAGCTAGDELELRLDGLVYHSSANGTVAVGFYVGTADVGPPSGAGYAHCDSPSTLYPMTAVYQHTVAAGELSAGAVTVKARWKTDTGTASFKNDASSWARFSVENIGPAQA